MFFNVSLFSGDLPKNNVSYYFFIACHVEFRCSNSQYNFFLAYYLKNSNLLCMFTSGSCYCCCFLFVMFVENSLLENALLIFICTFCLIPKFEF